jgi:hypothetical protein
MKYEADYFSLLSLSSRGNRLPMDRDLSAKSWRSQLSREIHLNPETVQYLDPT